MEALQKENEQLRLELAAATQDNAKLRAQLEPATLLPGLGWRVVDAQDQVIGTEAGSGRRWKLVELPASVSEASSPFASSLELAHTLTFDS